MIRPEVKLGKTVSDRKAAEIMAAHNARYPKAKAEGWVPAEVFLMGVSEKEDDILRGLRRNRNQLVGLVA